MSDRVVKSIPHPSGLRRVDIIRRDDGSFGFEEWYFSDDRMSNAWVSAYRQMFTVTDTFEAAEREARGRV